MPPRIQPGAIHAFRRASVRRVLSTLALLMLPALPVRRASAQNPELTDRMIRLFQANCTLCHGDLDPSRGLNLSGPTLLRATVNVPSVEVPDLRLIQPNDPEGSYLVHKIRGDEGIRGRRMPASGRTLTEEEIQTVIAWIRSFPAAWGGEHAAGTVEGTGGGAGAAMQTVSAHTPTQFMDSRVALLPAPGPLEPGQRRFDILHRFIGTLKNSDFGEFFGLDFGANISFQFGYGVLPGLEVGVRRSSGRAHWEFLAKYLIAPEGSLGVLPLSVGLFASHGATTRDTFTNRSSWNAQLLLGLRPIDRISILLAPSYATHTHPFNAGVGEGTLALGIGAEILPSENLAVVLETIPVLSGYDTGNPAATAGIKYRYGGHTFMLLITNDLEMNTDAYLPGGDLDLSNDYRLGFNITRRIFR